MKFRVKSYRLSVLKARRTRSRGLVEGFIKLVKRAYENFLIFSKSSQKKHDP